MQQLFLRVVYRMMPYMEWFLRQSFADEEERRRAEKSEEGELGEKEKENPSTRSSDGINCRQKLVNLVGGALKWHFYPLKIIWNDRFYFWVFYFPTRCCCCTKPMNNDKYNESLSLFWQESNSWSLEENHQTKWVEVKPRIKPTVNRFVWRWVGVDRRLQIDLYGLLIDHLRDEEEEKPIRTNQKSILERFQPL